MVELAEGQIQGDEAARSGGGCDAPQRWVASFLVAFGDGGKSDRHAVASEALPRLTPIDRLVAELCGLPRLVRMRTPVSEYEQLTADFTAPECREIVLAMRVVIDGEQDVSVTFRRVKPGDYGLVAVTFAFDLHRPAPSAVRASDSALFCYREFCCDILDAWPVLIGTLGTADDALGGGIYGERWMIEERVSLAEYADQVLQELNDGGFRQTALPGGTDDAADAEAGDGENPGPPVGLPRLWQYYDLLESGFRAEDAYARMYESRSPKDDRDDAVAFLARGIELARMLGLRGCEAGFSARRAHVEQIYAAQFRMR